MHLTCYRLTALMADFSSGLTVKTDDAQQLMFRMFDFLKKW